MKNNKEYFEILNNVRQVPLKHNQWPNMEKHHLYLPGKNNGGKIYFHIWLQEHKLTDRKSESNPLQRKYFKY